MDTLEQWLESRNHLGNASIPEKPDPEERAWNDFADNLVECLRGTPEAEEHPSLEELRLFARQRKECGGEWILPSHVARCPLCLDVFEALVAGIPEVSPAGRTRFMRVFEESRPRPGLVLLHARRFAVAAVVLILVCAGMVIVQRHRGRVPIMVAGGCLHVEGQPAIDGRASVSAGRLYTALKQTRVIMAGGIAVDIAGRSRISFRVVARNSFVDLTDGTVSVHAPALPHGRRFTVSTPLGDAVVVGTSFSVACRQEQAVEYRNDGQGNISSRPLDVTSVAIAVTDGTVQVSNRNETVLVKAGHQAILRNGEPKIDVTRTTP